MTTYYALMTADVSPNSKRDIVYALLKKDGWVKLGDLTTAWKKSVSKNSETEAFNEIDIDLNALCTVIDSKLNASMECTFQVGQESIKKHSSKSSVW